MNSSGRRPLRRSSVLAASAFILTLLACALAVDAEGDGGFVQVASHASAIAVHEDLLVWTRDQYGQVDLMATDLVTGEDRFLTSLTGISGAGLRDLDHDGTIVCWIDDRLRTPDVFLLDMASGRQERLSNDAGWETALDIADGRVAWAGAAGLQVHAFGNGTTWRMPQDHPVGDVAFDGEALAWASTVNGTRLLHRSALDGTGRQVLDGDARHFVHSISQDGGILAWHVQVLGVGHVGIGGYQVRFLDDEGKVGNLSAETPTAILGPWTGGGRVAWIEATPARTVRVVDALGVDLAQHRIPAKALALTEGQLVVLTQDGTVIARPWTSVSSSMTPIPTPAFLLAIAALAVALLRRRIA